MKTHENALTAFLQHIAIKLQNSIYPCARQSAYAVNRIVDTDMQARKQPRQVDQCRALASVFLQYSSSSLTLLNKAQDDIHWADSGATGKPAALQRRLAFSELLGPTGMYPADDCRIGLFLQQEHTVYPAHRHAAEEFYLVLSGTALWQQGQHKAQRLPPDSCVFHHSWEPHSMTTDVEPMLALWCWTGTIDYKQYELLDQAGSGKES